MAEKKPKKYVSPSPIVRAYMERTPDPYIASALAYGWGMEQASRRALRKIWGK